MSHPYFFISRQNAEQNVGQTAENTLNTADKEGPEEIELSGKDFHHLVRVLRAVRGDIVELSDNHSSRFITEIAQLEKDRAILTVKEIKKISKKIPEVFLFQSILKKEAMELAIQKTAEIGIDALVPVISSRIVAKIDRNGAGVKVKRWQQIAAEASKQCKRDFECRVLDPVPVKDIDADSYDLFFAPVETTPLLQAADAGGNKNISSGIIKIENIDRVFNSSSILRIKKMAYIIGPEGGFEQNEVDMLNSKGVVLINFGSNILRAETAAVYFLSVLDYLIKKAAGS